jgi:hypothetical protein
VLSVDVLGAITMLDLIATIRPYAELAFYIAGVFLVVGLWFTYVQLRLLKRDMLLRVERAAKEKAIEAGRLYF